MVPSGEIEFALFLANSIWKSVKITVKHYLSTGTLPDCICSLLLFGKNRLQLVYTQYYV